MELVVGGYAQGKREFAESELGVSADVFADGETCTSEEALASRGIDRFHLLIRRMLASGEDVQRFIEKLLDERICEVVIADEIGCGIVPVDAFEREYRDVAGRACQRIAAASQAVYRVCCGIGTRIR